MCNLYNITTSQDAIREWTAPDDALVIVDKPAARRSIFGREPTLAGNCHCFKRLDHGGGGYVVPYGLFWVRNLLVWRAAVCICRDRR